MSSSVPSMQNIKQSMRATWMAGNFGEIAKNTVRIAEEFVSRLAIRPGVHALDIACGSGNVAIPMARAGAIVTGVDIAPNLLAQGRERAAAESLIVNFDEGDAEQLPYNDASFDVVATMFGAMFAPRPELVASEIARVLKPGGLLAMANWNPASFTGDMFRTTAKHVPPPPGVPSPLLWGDQKAVREYLGSHFTMIRTELIPIEFDLPYSPAGVVEYFRTYFGPTQVAFSRLDGAGQAALASDLIALWSKANVAPDPGQHTVTRNEYLQVTANRA
ncbi:MAG: class I SAM-dependent methyltransferase [Candidatus Korobacteraceae bacterium]